MVGCDFFCNDTAPPEVYTLSLHDALPISARRARILDDSTTPDRFEGDPGFNEAGTRESFGWMWLPVGDRPDPTTGWA